MARKLLVCLVESVPDLIITDIRMPGMDGYHLVRHLRESPRTTLTTAKDETADRVAGFKAGID
jgi:DNA-binding response OmpR family regulator